MNPSIETMLAELCTLVADLGKGGGQISPSIYDTAQVLRLYPPQEGVEAGLEWLLTQQQADGGWGESTAPYARDVPTLATILALNAYEQDARTAQAIEAGLAFLRQQAPQWADIPLDALPIATEMILPYLIEEAQRARLTLDPEPYAALFRLRQKKTALITSSSLRPGAAPTYSWQALGQDEGTIRPDASGGIGHSPAATAAWLRQAEQHLDLTADCATAQAYLQHAAAATGVNIPGVVPNVWPITGFELAYAPYALLITTLLQNPSVRHAVEPILDELWIIMQRGKGVSFGEYFTPDVDDTGLATAVLHATSHPVDSAAILQFKHDDHFCTFQYELNPSIFVNAHALYGLAHTGERYFAAENFLIERQCTDGRWLADKSHSSWLYVTLEVVLVLCHLGHQKEVQKAIGALIHYQKADGGWGMGETSTRIETSYALITLATANRYELLPEAGRTALQRGHEWLQQLYQPNTLSQDKLWLGKELYAPYRVDRIYELSALLSTVPEKIFA